MLKQINNISVKPVPLIGGADTRPIRGADLFPELYANIFLCAKKKSGKSSVVYKILNECCGRDTKVLAFVSTIHKDNAWLQIAELCKRKGVYFEPHTSLKEEGIDQLDLFLQEQALPDEESPSSGSGASLHKKLLLQDDHEAEKKPRKEKKQSPEWIVILDDLSTELKSKSLVSLLKKNRHLKAKVIVASQYLNDMLPEARKQLDYFLLFKGQSKEKLETIYKDADVGIEFDEFNQLYEKAVEEKYSFLYIDTRSDDFRKNFNFKFTR